MLSVAAEGCSDGGRVLLDPRPVVPAAFRLLVELLLVDNLDVALLRGLTQREDWRLLCYCLCLCRRRCVLWDPSYRGEKVVDVSAAILKLIERDGVHLPVRVHKANELGSCKFKHLVTQSLKFSITGPHSSKIKPRQLQGPSLFAFLDMPAWLESPRR